MANIFISYSQKDRRRVEPLLKAMKAEGYEVWWNPEIHASESFDELIESTLEKVRYVLPSGRNTRWSPSGCAPNRLGRKIRENSSPFESMKTSIFPRNSTMSTPAAWWAGQALGMPRPCANSHFESTDFRRLFHF